jgi:hypothetical protein
LYNGLSLRNVTGYAAVGELVWEDVKPYYGCNASVPDSPETNNVFRAFRYSEQEIALAKHASYG